MRTVFQTMVSQQVAQELIEAMIEASFQFCDTYNPQDQDAFWTADNHLLMVVDAENRSLVDMWFEPDVFILSGETPSGCTQEIRINIESGIVSVIHDGDREDWLGDINYFLPKRWNTLNLKCIGWTLVEYTTKHKSWAACSCFLDGQQGAGPKNKTAKREYELKQKVQNWEVICLAAGYEIPGKLVPFDGSVGLCDHDGNLSVFVPKFQGINYRRLAAHGIRLPINTVHE